MNDVDNQIGLTDKEFFLSLFYQKESFLSRLESVARKRKVPIIRREMMQFLELVLALKNPRNILEIGTAIGFSALLMSGYLPEDGQLITIERNPIMWKEAEKQLDKAKKFQIKLQEQGKKIEKIKPNQIQILKGDARDLLPCQKDKFDFIFLDSAKAQYINFLPQIIKLLNKNGILITDNTLQNDEILKSKYILPRRERTTYKRMRQYLKAIGHHPKLKTYYFGLADGVTVSIKRSKEDN